MRFRDGGIDFSDDKVLRHSPVRMTMMRRC